MFGSVDLGFALWAWLKNGWLLLLAASVPIGRSTKQIAVVSALSLSLSLSGLPTQVVDLSVEVSASLTGVEFGRSLLVDCLICLLTCALVVACLLVCFALLVDCLCM